MMILWILDRYAGVNGCKGVHSGSNLFKALVATAARDAYAPTHSATAPHSSTRLLSQQTDVGAFLCDRLRSFHSGPLRLLSLLFAVELFGLFQTAIIIIVFELALTNPKARMNKIPVVKSQMKHAKTSSTRGASLLGNDAKHGGDPEQEFVKSKSTAAMHHHDSVPTRKKSVDEQHEDTAEAAAPRVDMPLAEQVEKFHPELLPLLHPKSLPDQRHSWKVRKRSMS